MNPLHQNVFALHKTHMRTRAHYRREDIFSMFMTLAILQVKWRKYVALLPEMAILELHSNGGAIVKSALKPVKENVKGNFANPSRWHVTTSVK